MKPTIELLEDIRKNVVLYIGIQSLTRLASFIRGYEFAVYINNPTSRSDFFSSFQDWLRTKYEVKISKSWEDIIIFNSVDDYDALAHFWNLLDEYKASIR